jgi:hypothetical protein
LTAPPAAAPALQRGSVLSATPGISLAAPNAVAPVVAIEPVVAVEPPRRRPTGCRDASIEIRLREPHALRHACRRRAASRPSHLRLTRRAARRRRSASPRDGGGVGQPPGDTVQQPRPPFAVHGDASWCSLTVPPPRALYRIRGLEAQGRELVGVGGELQQRGHPGGAGELGVLHEVPAVGLANDEVGEAEEVVAEECRLEHDVRPAAEGRLGGGNGGLERAVLVRVGALDLNDSPAERVR